MAGGTAWRLPGYVVGDRLGTGGTGEVWAARVAATQEPVALKRVALGAPDAVRAARSEAALLATLDHPHLVRVHALVSTLDAAVLVLDLADGGSLADLLAARGRLAVGEVVTALAPIGSALAYAHQHGVVHGDVSAANVLFTSIGLPMLADLGVARIVGDAVPVRSTPEYVDPAVAAGCVPGPSSDVFMLGALALHALTGAPLWRGGNADEVLAAAALGDLAGVSDRLSAVPRAVAAVVERALASNPQRRCSAAEFALDLRYSASPLPVELAAGRRGPARPASVSPAAARDVSRGPGAHRAPSRADASARQRTDRPGRPAFDRPSRPPATPGRSGALTHAVRPPPRPTLPAPSRLRRTVERARRAVRTRRLRLVGCAAVVLVAGAVTAIVLWGPHRATVRPARLADARSSLSDAKTPPAASAPATSPAESRTPRPVEQPSAALAASTPDIATVLHSLDETREEAFARRDPTLLDGVYTAGSLLERDRDLLLRVVPAGCGLFGARTDFRDVQADAPSAAAISVRVTAQLHPSTLRCAGQDQGDAPGVGPTRLRMQLARTPAGYRISGESAG
jgi:Protein kinase domain